MCECIVIMRGYKEVNWKTAKGMMSDTNFLSALQNMDVDAITPAQVREQRYMCYLLDVLTLTICRYMNIE